MAFAHRHLCIYLFIFQPGWAISIARRGFGRVVYNGDIGQYGIFQCMGCGHVIYKVDIGYYGLLLLYMEFLDSDSDHLESW